MGGPYLPAELEIIPEVGPVTYSVSCGASKPLRRLKHALGKLVDQAEEHESVVLSLPGGSPEDLNSIMSYFIKHNFHAQLAPQDATHKERKHVPVPMYTKLILCEMPIHPVGPLGVALVPKHLVVVLPKTNAHIAQAVAVHDINRICSTGEAKAHIYLGADVESRLKRHVYDLLEEPEQSGKLGEAIRKQMKLLDQCGRREDQLKELEAQEGALKQTQQYTQEVIQLCREKYALNAQIVELSKELLQTKSKLAAITKDVGASSSSKKRSEREDSDDSEDSAGKPEGEEVEEDSGGKPEKEVQEEGDEEEGYVSATKRQNDKSVPQNDALLLSPTFSLNSEDFSSGIENAAERQRQQRKPIHDESVSSSTEDDSEVESFMKSTQAPSHIRDIKRTKDKLTTRTTSKDRSRNPQQDDQSSTGRQTSSQTVKKTAPTVPGSKVRSRNSQEKEPTCSASQTSSKTVQKTAQTEAGSKERSMDSEAQKPTEMAASNKTNTKAGPKPSTSKDSPAADVTDNGGRKRKASSSSPSDLSHTFPSKSRKSSAQFQPLSQSVLPRSGGKSRDKVLTSGGNAATSLLEEVPGYDQGPVRTSTSFADRLDNVLEPEPALTDSADLSMISRLEGESGIIIPPLTKPLRNNKKLGTGEEKSEDNDKEEEEDEGMIVAEDEDEDSELINSSIAAERKVYQDLVAQKQYKEVLAGGPKRSSRISMKKKGTRKSKKAAAANTSKQNKSFRIMDTDDLFTRPKQRDGSGPDIGYVDKKVPKNIILDQMAWLDSTKTKSLVIYKKADLEEQTSRLLNQVKNQGGVFLHVNILTCPDGTTSATISLFVYPSYHSVILIDEEVGIQLGDNEDLAGLFTSPDSVIICEGSHTTRGKIAKLLPDREVCATFIDAIHFAGVTPRFWDDSDLTQKARVSIILEEMKKNFQRGVRKAIIDEYEARVEGNDRVFLARTFKKTEDDLLVQKFASSEFTKDGKGNDSSYTLNGKTFSFVKCNMPLMVRTVKERLGQDFLVCEQKFFWDILLDEGQRQKTAADILLFPAIFPMMVLMYHILTVQIAFEVKELSISDMTTHLYRNITALGKAMSLTSNASQSSQGKASVGSEISRILGPRPVCMAWMGQQSLSLDGRDPLKSFFGEDIASLGSTYNVLESVRYAYHKLVLDIKEFFDGTNDYYIPRDNGDAQLLSQFKEFALAIGSQRDEFAEPVVSFLSSAWSPEINSDIIMSLALAYRQKDKPTQRVTIMVTVRYQDTNATESPQKFTKDLVITSFAAVRNPTIADNFLNINVKEVQAYVVFAMRKVLEQKNLSDMTRIVSCSSFSQTFKEANHYDPGVYAMLSVRNRVFEGTPLVLDYENDINNEALLRSHLFRELMEQTLYPVDVHECQKKMLKGRFCPKIGSVPPPECYYRPPAEPSQTQNEESLVPAHVVVHRKAVVQHVKDAMKSRRQQVKVPIDSWINDVSEEY